MKGGIEMLFGASKEKPMKGDEDEGDELSDAMSDLGEALMDKDWSGAAAAFRRAHTICGGYEDEDDSEEA